MPSSSPPATWNPPGPESDLSLSWGQFTSPLTVGQSPHPSTEPLRQVLWVTECFGHQLSWLLCDLEQLITPHRASLSLSLKWGSLDLSRVVVSVQNQNKASVRAGSPGRSFPSGLQLRAAWGPGNRLQEAPRRACPLFQGLSVWPCEGDLSASQECFHDATMLLAFSPSFALDCVKYKSSLMWFPAHMEGNG